ncbi:MAG: DegT/DnrJ/EryC1/StrS family aminotransferase [Deltaproteobacteria bacterium]|nr:DegT/DnrJ/EryC1/StrS family aminotransferase [Deltaproteobacteria bacterium]
MQQIKFVDLAAQNAEIHDDVQRALARIHAETAYIGGPAVRQFEEEFASFLGVRHVIGVNSGTDALRLSLLALGIGVGDEVITTPMTFIATVEAIVQVGARPVFVDIEPQTYNLSVAAVRHYLEEGHFNTPNGPKAIMPVHLYGMPAAMSALGQLAHEFGLPIVEDACQAHGAQAVVNGRWIRVGAIGAAGCFSFYPAKNLGAWGEAGAVATNDDGLAEQVILLRDHGRISHYAHQAYGYNARLDALQAAVLSAKLKRLEQWNMHRREIADAYRTLLGGTTLPLWLPTEPPDVESVYHLFVVRSPRRDALRSGLLTNQIECGIHYPLPLHLQPACRALGYRAGDFPESERAADAVLSLPMHPHLKPSELERIANVTVQSLIGDHGLFAGERYDHRAACLPPPRSE